MKLGHNSRVLRLVFGILLLFIGSGTIFAQNDKPKISENEAKAAKKVQDAKLFPDILAASVEFLKKFPKSSLRTKIVGNLVYQVFVSKDNAQIISNAQGYFGLLSEPADVDMVIPSLVDAYIALKKTDEAFSTAAPYIARHDDDVALRLQLAIEGSNQLRLENKKYAAQTRSYSLKAIELIEGNKKPEDVTDEKWLEYQTRWLPELYSSLGFTFFNERDWVSAQRNFEKTVKLDKVNVTGWFLLGTIANENYQEMAQKYSVATGSEKAALLLQANGLLDTVIDLYAHVIGLTEGNTAYQPLNAQMHQDIESYYKYRHGGSLKGMQEMIDKYKPTATN